VQNVMDMKLIPTLLLLFTIFWPQYQANAQELTAIPINTPIKEVYKDEVPVSGRVIAGVTMTGYAPSARLSLMVPVSEFGKKICIQVMTRDGRYLSKNTFQLPDKISNIEVPLSYRSKHEAFLAQQDPDDLAVLGTPRECSDTDMDTVFLTSTGDSSAGDRVVSVFVNSGRSDTYLSVKNDADKPRPARCQMIEKGRRTGYDTICKINLNELTAIPDQLDIKILRRHYERMLPATEFTLILPRLD